MPTAHLAAEYGDFAPAVLMPGDPLRARRIAEQFLDDARLVTQVRGILGFTGTHAGYPVSVLASGMGMPSLTIYATELVRHFGVRSIVRVGTAGVLQPEIVLGQIVAAASAHTDSNMTTARMPGVNFSHAASFPLLRRAVEHSDRSRLGVRVGPVFTTDHFYLERPALIEQLADYGTLAVDMEAAGLYAVAAEAGIEALAIMTATDSLVTGERLTSEERETTFSTMAECALAAIIGDNQDDALFV